MIGPSHRRLVIQWKSWGVIVISLLAIWKVWVVSHHLPANVCIRMALAELSGSKQRMGSKPASHTKAFMSSARALYQEEMWLVLPLTEKGGKTCKEMKGEHENCSWITKWVKMSQNIEN